MEAALFHLSARQQSHLSERPFFDVERERKMRALGAGPAGGGAGGEEEGGQDSSGFLTPDGSLGSASTGTNYSNGSSRPSGSSGGRSYLPDRLQIVKPLEGEEGGGLVGGDLCRQTVWLSEGEQMLFLLYY